MIYEFRYRNRVYDRKTAEELPSAVAVKKHAEKLKEHYNLPYITVSERMQ